MEVTAIISAYYAENYLKGRLENLFEQSLVPNVIVVCNYDSAELEIAHSFKKSVFQPIHIIQTTRIPTIYGAWNTALSFVTTPYVTNANSDDRLYPGALETLARTLDNNPEVSLAYSFCDATREVDALPYQINEFMEGGLEELRKKCFLGPMPMWRYNLHEKYGKFDDTYKVAGDYEFWLRCMFYGEKAIRIPMALGAYTVRKDSRERREPLLTTWESARARARYHDGNSGYTQEAGYAKVQQSEQAHPAEIAGARDNSLSAAPTAN